MPRGFNGVGTGTLVLSSGRATTGATPWIDLQASFQKFGMQCVFAAGTTSYTVLLQGTLTTASTTPKQLISYTKAADSVSVKFSTGTIPPVSKIRASVSVIGGNAAKLVRIYATALP